jgi:siroheme synthase-like protein
VDASLETVISRDTKGLYARALAGEVERFTGISDPYEPPERPEVHLRTDAESEAASEVRLLRALAERGLVSGESAPEPGPGTPALYPVFLRLEERLVVVVGGGPLAREKTRSLLEAGARVTVVAPDISFEDEHPRLVRQARPFCAADLDGAWYVVAAATPEVNRRVVSAATRRRLFVNVVDDPARATAYAAGILRRGGVTLAVSTAGAAPALSRLLREALGEVLPHDVARWNGLARALRARWKAEGTPFAERTPQLLVALNRLYETAPPEGGAP